MIRALLFSAFAAAALASNSSSSDSDVYSYAGANSTDTSTGSATGNTDYASILDDLWTQVGGEKGYLTESEFETALSMLGVTVGVGSPSDYTLFAHSDAATFFAEIDDGDGALYAEELASAARDYPNYQEPLINAFTNGAGNMPDLDGLIAVDPAIADGTAHASFSFTISQAPESIYAGTRNSLKTHFADIASVSIDAVIMTFLPATARRQRQLIFVDALPAQRQLSTSGTVVDITIFVDSADSAAALQRDILPQSAADVEAIPAMSGFTVTSFEPPTSQVRYPALPIVPTLIVAVVLVVAGFALCTNAKFWASAKAKKNGQTPGVCCKTGCCSFNAVKPWAFGEFVAALCLLGGVFWLYQNFGGITTAIIGLLDVLLSLVNATLPAISSFTSMVPGAIVNILNQQRAQFELLPIAVMVPGILAALFLILSSLCAASPGRKGTYCCSKLAMFFGTLFLILCLIFYSIFIGIAVIVTFAPPAIQEPLNIVQAMCISIPANLNQIKADNLGAIGKLEAAGQDVSAFTAQIDDISLVIDAISSGCENINLLFQSLFGLFLPGLICVVAIVFALFVNNTLCCAAGCCAAPPKTAPKFSPKGPSMDENVSV